MLKFKLAFPSIFFKKMDQKIVAFPALSTPKSPKGDLVHRQAKEIFTA